MTVGEMPSHGHLVRTWNSANSGEAKVYRDGQWVPYIGGIFVVNGAWADNAYKTCPQNGCGDQAGTTDGTGGNSYHNILQPSIVVYRFKRIS